MTADAAHLSRAERARLIHARDVAELVASENGVCVRTLAFRVTDTQTGQARVVEIPCGATLEAKCAACAARARQLRMMQCREGWHLEEEPVSDPDPATEGQQWLIAWRADVQAKRDAAYGAGDPDAAVWDAAIEEIDREINEMGMVGSVVDGRVSGARRSRSTRRRQDAPDLPCRAMSDTTLGRLYVGKDGQRFRPSMFLTLTLPSYGRVKDGAPVDADRYDYRRAARDALHFSKLVDRFVQNLRRMAGFDVQYFATVEPQKRLAPHLHMAIRGTMSRADIKAVVAATYHQVWWPSTGHVRYEGDRLPVWVERPGREGGKPYADGQMGDYVDPDSGEVLPTWDDALDELGEAEHAEPLHVVRFGSQVDVQGVLSGSSDADQCIRYIAKYLTKSLGGSIEPDEVARRAHASRMVDALRFEPCSARCSNWLRFGVQPKGAKAGLMPGRCRSKAHRAEHLGYAGRRVLVSRKWSNKTLREHKADRRAWVLNVLGIADVQSAYEPGRWLWAPIPEGDASLEPRAVRTLRQVAERQKWRRYLRELQAAAEGGEVSTVVRGPVG